MTDQSPPASADETAASCTCASDVRGCPYHGEAPTLHDTYAEHCREHVPGTPSHGGGRCDLCDRTVPAPPVPDAPAERHPVTAESGTPEVELAREIFGRTTAGLCWALEAARAVLKSDWLAERDRKVEVDGLRRAASEFDLIWNRGHDDSLHPYSHLLRERADRIDTPNPYSRPEGGAQ